MARIAVRGEPARQADVERLLALSDAVAAQLYPGAFRRAIDTAALDKPDIVVLVARTEVGVAVGCCALLLADHAGELKRMIVDPTCRGQGVGAALVATACSVARARGFARLQLEVGIRNIDARALYARLGFTACGPFGPYHETPIASFMMKSLDDA